MTGLDHFLSEIFLSLTISLLALYLLRRALQDLLTDLCRGILETGPGLLRQSFDPRSQIVYLLAQGHQGLDGLIMKFPGNASSFLFLGSGYLLEEKLELSLRLL